MTTFLILITMLGSVPAWSQTVTPVVPVVPSVPVVPTVPGVPTSPNGGIARDPGHPRVNEVNQRLNNEQARINRAEAAGKLNPQQANSLEKKEQNIKNQEARDMAKNGGHLTPGEQKRLNHEENHVNRKINKDEAHKRVEMHHRVERRNRR